MAVVEATRPQEDSPENAVEARAATALLTCIARYGLTKTTLDDVAREARCSRATLYRYFDSKQDLVRRTAAGEIDRLTARVVEAGRAQSTFSDAVVAVVVTAAHELTHHAALRFLLAHEPEAILTHLTFGPGDRLLTSIADALAPAFTQWLPLAEAARAGDWLAPFLRSYVLMPVPTIDLTDERAARPFLHEFVIPGLSPESQFEESQFEESR